jgi:outer membrane protein W
MIINNKSKGGIMGRYIGICFLGLAVFFTTVGLVFAQREETGEFFYTDFQIEDRLNLGVKGGGVLSQMDKTYNFGGAGAPNAEVKGKDGWWVTGILTYDLGDYLAVGIESGYMEYDVDAVHLQVTGNLGTARNTPLLGDIFLKYSFDMEEYAFVPYAVFGAGTIFSDFKESTLATNNNLSISTKNAYAMKYGGGFDFYLTDNVAVNIEGTYLDTDIKTSASVIGVGSAVNKIKNDSWMVGGGLKYLF